jgi:hypothetical protein
MRTLWLGLAALLLSGYAHASAIYRVDFTAVFDSGMYWDITSEGTLQPFDWTGIVGATAYGHWLFKFNPYGFIDEDCCYDVPGYARYDSFIPYLHQGSFYDGAGGDTVIRMNDDIWRAGRQVSSGNIRGTEAQINMPDLASSRFEFWQEGGTYANDAAILCPGIADDPWYSPPVGYTVRGRCLGFGHLTSISISQVQEVGEPASLALVVLGLLGIVARRSAWAGTSGIAPRRAAPDGA